MKSFSEIIYDDAIALKTFVRLAWFNEIIIFIPPWPREMVNGVLISIPSTIHSPL